jgi:hypothetical protein
MTSDHPADWKHLFDRRERDEIEFAIHYQQYFHHGTDGHHRLMLIAKFADLLDQHFYGTPDETHPDS